MHVGCRTIKQNNFVWSVILTSRINNEFSNRIVLEYKKCFIWTLKDWMWLIIAEGMGHIYHNLKTKGLAMIEVIIGERDKMHDGTIFVLFNRENGSMKGLKGFN